MFMVFKEQRAPAVHVKCQGLRIGRGKVPPQPDVVDGLVFLGGHIHPGCILEGEFIVGKVIVESAVGMERKDGRIAADGVADDVGVVVPEYGHLARLCGWGVGEEVSKWGKFGVSREGERR
jgi:hypothetical protein